MSTEYRFVNKEKKEQIDQLRQMLEKERDALVAKIYRFGEKNPLTASSVEDVVFSIRQGMSGAQLQAFDDDEIIGVATSAKFHWNTSNGFQSISDVEQFLTDHPDYSIENDYGSLISLCDFKASVKDIV